MSQHIVLAGNDAPDIIKDLINNGVYDGFIADGTDDEEEVQDAHDALSGGGLLEAYGTFYLSDTPVFSNSNLEVNGHNCTKFQTVTSLTNSLSVTGYNCIFKNFEVYGSYAGRFYNVGSYNTFDKVYFNHHGYHNFYQDNNGATTINGCKFFGRQLTFEGDGALTVTGNTYFNGNGNNACIVVPKCSNVNIINNVFEQYAWEEGTHNYAAINIGDNNYTIHGARVCGNYFETTHENYRVIDLWLVNGAEVSGNIEYVDTNHLGDFSMLVFHGRNIEVTSNKFINDIQVHPTATVYNCRIEADGYSYFVDYQGYKLPYLYKRYVGGKSISEFCGTAAPTSGTWVQGDTEDNTSPTANGIDKWRCVTGGTPGTWKSVKVEA